MPTIAVSEQTFNLKNVRVIDAVKIPYMALLCESEPPAELRLLLNFKSGCFPLYAGEESVWLHFLRFARAAEISMSLDVSVCEKIKTGQRTLLVVNIHDPETIINTLHQQLDGIAQGINPFF